MANNVNQGRLAIIGCGYFSRTHLLSALRRSNWIPSVLVDPASQRVNGLVQDLGARVTPITAPDWTSVADRFDAAIVAVPNASHGRVATALTSAGKHVLIEPPLATQQAECRAAVASAERSGTILLGAHPRRHLGVLRWTDAVIRSGVLGPVRRVDWCEGDVFNRSDATDPVLWPDEGGVLANPGIHSLDVLSWWLGDITPVHYRDDSAGGVESECFLDFRAGETDGRMELSRSRKLPNTCFIEGEKGFLEVHLHRNEVIRCSPNVQSVLYQGLRADSFPSQETTDLFLAVLKDFRSAVTGAGSRRRVHDHECTAVAFIGQCYAMRTAIKRPWAPARARPESLVIEPGTRVVVTGATGFIGGHLLERLVEQRARVSCLIRSPASAIQLARLPVEFRRVDLTDKLAVNEALRDTEFVFHCAYDWNNAGANRRGTSNLIEACIAHGVKRLVHLSTFSVYGLQDGEFNETTADGDRSSEYTRVKLELEKDVLDAVRERGLRATVLQPTIVYGAFSKPWTINPAEMLMYDTFVLPDRGEGLCNALFVEDLVDAMMLAAVRPEAVGERFIISGPDAVTWSEFYETFARSLGAKGPQYWPRDRIAKRHSGLTHKVRVAVTDPKKLVRAGMRVPVLRDVLNLSWRTLPSGARAAIQDRYSPKSRPVGQLHVPDRNQLSWLSLKSVADTAKARRLIGYNPRVDFKSGMAFTTRYLEWAFGIGRAGPPPASSGAESRRSVVGEPHQS